VNLVAVAQKHVRAHASIVAAVLAAIGLVLFAAGILTGRWNINLFAIAFLGAAFGLALPRLAWAAYVACTFLTGISVDVGGISFRPELLAIPLLAAAVWRLSWEHERARVPKLVLAAAAVWLALTLVSSLLFAPEPSSSLWIWIQEFLGVIAFILVARSVADKHELVEIGLRVAGAVVGGFIVVYLFWPLSQSGVDPTDVRLSGFSFEPNLFAAHCLAWLGVSYYWRAHRTRWSVVYEALLVLGLILAGTRASWIGGLVLATFIAANFLRGRGWSPARIALGIAGAAAVVFAAIAAATTLLGGGGRFIERIVTLVDFSSGTGAYRLEIYGWALDDFAAPWRWVLGSGANSFSQLHPMDPTNVGPAYLSTVWLSMPYDAGVIGGVAFFVAIAGIWWAASRRADAIPLVAGLLICATATNSFWMAFPWVALALLIDKTAPAKLEPGG
jgi:hypothetical protein